MSKIDKRIEELFVEKKVKNFLISEYDFIDDGKNKELWEHGVDIKLKHKNYGQYFLVECKGEPGARGPVKAFSGSMSSSINSALGQIVSRMHTDRKSRYGGYNYAVAFPESFRSKVIKRVPYYVCKSVRLRLFFVNKSGEVDEIRWGELKRKQLKDKEESKEKGTW